MSAAQVLARVGAVGRSTYTEVGSRAQGGFTASDASLALVPASLQPFFPFNRDPVGRAGIPRQGHRQGHRRGYRHNLATHTNKVHSRSKALATNEHVKVSQGTRAFCR